MWYQFLVTNCIVSTEELRVRVGEAAQEDTWASSLDPSIHVFRLIQAQSQYTVCLWVGGCKQIQLHRILPMSAEKKKDLCPFLFFFQTKFDVSLCCPYTIIEFKGKKHFFCVYICPPMTILFNNFEGGHGNSGCITDVLSLFVAELMTLVWQDPNWKLGCFHK